MLFQCSIFTFFCRLVRRLHVNLRTLFCLTKRWQIQIIYRFTWKYIICLRCVCLKLADCFLSSPSLNICLSSLLSSVKRRHILLTWVSVWDSAHYFHSIVSNVNFVLWRRGGPETFPVCPDIDSMCWMCNYRNIFIIGREKSLKVHFALIYFFGFETYRLIGS